MVAGGIVIGRMLSPSGCHTAAPNAADEAPVGGIAELVCFAVAGVAVPRTSTAGAGAADPCETVPAVEDRAWAAGAGAGLRPG